MVRLSLTARSADHPRIRGEHRRADPPDRPPPGSSPHTRGAPPDLHGPGPFSGIIPAYAGSTTSSGSSSLRAADHPRIRGEHSQAGGWEGWQLASEGSSPHTRGAQIDGERHASALRIIPAYAGSTARPGAGRAGSWPVRDHPRIRGEHGPGPCGLGPFSGSSPHTRGARCSTCSGAPIARIIPAYAGSTSVPGAFPPCCTDHPRIRGEHRRRRGA